MFGTFGKRSSTKPTASLRVGIPGSGSARPIPPTGQQQRSPRLSASSQRSILAARAKARALSQQGSAAKRKLASSSFSSQLSPSEISRCLGLKISGIPPDCNNRDFLNKHFRVYGTLTKVAPRAKHGYAVIEFENHESARKAKVGASVLRPGTTPIKMAWIPPSTSNLKALMDIPTSHFPALATRGQEKRKGDDKPSFAFSFSPSKQTDITSSPVKTEETKAQLSRSAVVQQLRQLVGQKCHTSFDKFQLLQTRDKILQKGRVKVSDVCRAHSLLGRCPDMCPEKERYEREVQKRLSSFELGPDGTLDHAVAVKDYSRSSADQDEPLPHELRPPRVLGMTMDYLMGQVAFECPAKEAHVPPWYDFLWNRTRGLRKDITQQMLAGPLAVDLVEKCARFHIYSAHRLCQMGIGDFDQKMNTENLTKCLQTLRHLYEDLGKAGVDCVNEAEFRAYDVLLNLNDSNILRQVLSYKKSVQESAGVRLAVKLFTTIQNNNYTGFFRLVRQRTDYLQASLLHRYFVQVRESALNIMSRAYQINSQYPVEGLVRMLGFEDSLEAVEFCQAYGLSASVETGGSVGLSRAVFKYPDTAVSPKISHSLIESKRASMALGEILTGGLSVSSVELPSPVMSFDSEGHYLSDPVIAEYLEESSLDSRAEREEAARRDEEDILRRRKIQILDNTVMRVGGKLIDEAIEEPLGFLAAETSFEAKSEFLYHGQLLAPIIKETVGDAKVAEVGRLEEMAKEKRRAAIRSLVGALAERQATGMISETCLDIVRESAAKELRLARMEKKKAEIESRAEILGGKLVHDSLTGLIREIGQAVHREEVAQRLGKLKQIRLNLDKWQIRKAFGHWRHLASENRRKRELLASFPLSPSRMSLAESAAALRPPLRGRLSLPGDREGLWKKMDRAAQRTEEWLKNSWERSAESCVGKEGVERLKAIRKNLDRSLLRQCLVVWRIQTRETKLRRDLLMTFPSSPPREDVLERSGRRLKREEGAGRVMRVGETAAIREGLHSVAERRDASRRERSSLMEHSFLEVSSKENDSIFIDFDAVSGIAGFVSPERGDGLNKRRRKEEWSAFLGDSGGDLERKRRRGVSIPGSERVEGLLAQLYSELRKEERSMAEDEVRWMAMLHP